MTANDAGNRYARHERSCTSRPCGECEHLAAQLIAAADAELDTDESAERAEQEPP